MTSAAIRLAEKLAHRRSLIENAIITHCPVPSFILRTNGTCESVNRLFMQLVRFSEEHLIQHGIACVVHPDDRESFEEAVRLAVKEGKGLQGYAHCVQPNKGEPVAVYTDMHFIESAGFVGFMVPACKAPKDCPLHCALLRHV